MTNEDVGCVVYWLLYNWCIFIRTFFVTVILNLTAIWLIIQLIIWLIFWLVFITIWFFSLQITQIANWSMALVDELWLVAKSCVVNISQLNGWIPHFCQAVLIVSLVSACLQTSIYSLIESTVWISCPVDSKMSSHLSIHCHWRGLKIPTSSGCVWWVVLVGSWKSSMLFSLASCSILSVRCDLWPS